MPNIMNNASPIFPSPAFTSEGAIAAPENQLSSQGGMSISIVLAEPIMFLEGFNPVERADLAPALLRGTLVLSVAKPTKVRAINLGFKGMAKTEWPEGIPPKRVETSESEDIYGHVWTFFNASSPLAEYSSGADLVRLDREHRRLRSESRGRGSPTSSRRPSASEMAGSHKERHSRRDSDASTASTSHSRSDSTHESSLRFLTGRFRRTASPTPPSSAAHSLTGVSLAPHRSFSKHEGAEQDTKSKGYRWFEPGEYIYNFELPIPHSVPETIHASYGSVHYFLEATIERPGTFRSNLVGRKEIPFVRSGGVSNLEASEPIIICKDWEDQLHYEISVGGKSFSIGSSIPVHVRLLPLSKLIKCHRLRIYVTETVEYYCRNKKVHRVEPTRKFLIHEHAGEQKASLLHEDGSVTEFNYSAGIPESSAPSSCAKGACSPFDHLRPNTGFENIQVHHWLKIVMRLSRPDPKDDKKRKYYEISIDSPISLLDSRCTLANLTLPQYSMPATPYSFNRLATPMPPTPGPPPTYDVAVNIGRHIQGDRMAASSSVRRERHSVESGSSGDSSNDNATTGSSEPTDYFSGYSMTRSSQYTTSSTASSQIEPRSPIDNSSDNANNDDASHDSAINRDNAANGANYNDASNTPDTDNNTDEATRNRGTRKSSDLAENHGDLSGTAQSESHRRHGSDAANEHATDESVAPSSPSSMAMSVSSEDEAHGSFLEHFPSELRRPLLSATRTLSHIKEPADNGDADLGQYATEAWLV